MNALARFLILTALLCAPDARAGTDREDLVKWCTQGTAVASGRCFGYLLAVEDVLATDSIKGVRACLPPGIKLQEQQRIVLDWLAAHPEAIGTAVDLVAKSYEAHAPCIK